MNMGDQACKYVIKNLEFNSVMDIGCGYGHHAEMFRSAGKEVTAVDIAMHYDHAVIGDYNKLIMPSVDLVWASHLLEHQLNVNNFLKKCRSETNEGGHICIVVPPLKHNIVGGHVTLWNAGLVMYNLILAGYNCANAIVSQHDYNIMVIAKAESFKLPNLYYDNGDIELLKDYFPSGYNYQDFNGDIQELNLMPCH